MKNKISLDIDNSRSKKMVAKINRKITPQTDLQIKNIVIIIME